MRPVDGPVASVLRRAAPRSRAPGFRPRWRLALFGLSAACACATAHMGEGPRSQPAGAEGMLLFTVGRLSFEAPAAWRASGDPHHALLVSPADDARIDAQLGQRRFESDAACLAQAQDALSRGATHLTNVRRHPTTLAGHKAVVQEADQEGWHGWAWAVCDRGEQFRLFFTGRSPMKEDGVRVVRRLSSSAVLAATPGA